MLTIFGKPHRNGGFCDGVSRRDFLTVGGTLLGGGLMLPNLLAAEKRAGIGSSHRAVINIFLPGGPPHLDMFDLKPDAPADVRGEFKPIKTNVPGIEICEHFPLIAKMMDKFAIIRSLSGSSGDHDAYQCMTGRKKEPAKAGFWPHLGAWVSKLQGTADPAIPANVSLMYPTGEARWGQPGDGGFLGLSHAPFRLVSGKANGMKSDNLTLKGVTLEQLNDRVGLKRGFDSVQRGLDNAGLMEGMDSYTRQAMNILTSTKLKDALDLSKEPKEVLERYGVDDPIFERDGAPRMVRNFCVARRLGAGRVTGRITGRVLAASASATGCGGDGDVAAVSHAEPGLERACNSGSGPSGGCVSGHPGKAATAGGTACATLTGAALAASVAGLAAITSSRIGMGVG